MAKKNMNTISVDEERTLVWLYQKGDQHDRDDAGQQLYEAYAAWIVDIIRKSFGPYFAKEQYRQDLISAGNLGFCKALDKYDPDKGSLSNYCLPYVLHELSNVVSKEIHTGTKSIQEGLKKKKIRKVAQELTGDNFEEANIYQVAMVTNEKVEIVVEALFPNEPLRLDQPISFNQEEEVTLGDTLVGNLVSPEDHLYNQEITETLHEALMTLDEISRQIVLLKHALIPGPQTRIGIAQAVGCMTDDVQPLYNNAINHLNQHPKLRALYFDQYEYQKSLILRDDMGLIPIETAESVMAQLDALEPEFVLIDDPAFIFDQVSC